MEIRRAARADLDAVKSLYEILFAEMAALQPSFFRRARQDDHFLEQVADSADAEILLAVEQHKVVGFALVQEKETPPYGCLAPYRYAYLMDLAVDESERGRGIGRALLDAVKGWAKARGLSYVELNVLSENAGAIRLYEREGYTERMRTLRCMLG